MRRRPPLHAWSAAGDAGRRSRLPRPLGAAPFRGRRQGGIPRRPLAAAAGRAGIRRRLCHAASRRRGTHCDALGHMWYGDKLWNGYRADCTNGGMKKAGIEPISAPRHCRPLRPARHCALSRPEALLQRAETFDHHDLLACAQGAGRRDRAAYDPHAADRLARRAAEMAAKGSTSDYWEPGLTFSRDLVAWFDAMQIPCLVTDTLANETTYEPNSGVMLPAAWRADAQSRRRLHGSGVARRSFRRLRAKTGATRRSIAQAPSRLSGEPAARSIPLVLK